MVEAPRGNNLWGAGIKKDRGGQGRFMVCFTRKKEKKKKNDKAKKGGVRHRGSSLPRQGNIVLAECGVNKKGGTYKWSLRRVGAPTLRRKKEDEKKTIRS